MNNKASGLTLMKNFISIRSNWYHARSALGANGLDLNAKVEVEVEVEVECIGAVE